MDMIFQLPSVRYARVTTLWVYEVLWISCSKEASDALWYLSQAGIDNHFLLGKMQRRA